MFTFDDTAAEKTPLVLTLPGGTVTLYFDAVTIADRLADDALAIERYQSTGAAHTAAYAARWTRRISKVSGWSGIEGRDGKPLRFTQDRLLKLLDRHPETLEQIGDFLKVFFEVVKTVTVGEPLPASTTPDAG